MRTRSERLSQQLTANSERLTDTCKCSSNEESHACTIRTCFGCPNQLKPKPSFQFSANLHLVFQFFTVRKRSCRKVIFLHLFVILFTRGSGTPPGRYHPWQTPPPRHTSLGRHPPARHPLADAPQKAATAAVGAHPTGMHFCSYKYFLSDKPYCLKKFSPSIRIESKRFIKWNFLYLSRRQKICKQSI